MSVKIKTKEDIDAAFQRLSEAQQLFATFTQAQVDEAFWIVTRTFIKHHIELARLAVEEVGFGRFEDKVIKNLTIAESVYSQYKDLKTVGVIEEDEAKGIVKIAEPIGVITALVPVTNPTVTAAFKIAIAVKTRNAILLAPHPRARRCTSLVAEYLNAALLERGFPEVIACITDPTVELSQYSMQHPRTSLVVATGGTAMVSSAYQSGTPALGVGPGNAPVIIDVSADLESTMGSIMADKLFDMGLPCTSENNLVIVSPRGSGRLEEVTRVLREHKVHVLDMEQRAKVMAVAFKDGHISAAVVGHSAEQIAALAKISVPPGTLVLCARAEKVGPAEPWSGEKLSPLLSLFSVGDINEAVALSRRIVEFGGMGHTAVLHSEDEASVRLFQSLPVTRLVVNAPSTAVTATKLVNEWTTATMSAGCGSQGRNSYCGPLVPQQLLNIKTVYRTRERLQWFRIPQRVYLAEGAMISALSLDLRGIKRAFVVTDAPLWNCGLVAPLTKLLRELDIEFECFRDVQPDPVFDDLKPALEKMKCLSPEVLIAFGGGSVIDAAKALNMAFSFPDSDIEALSFHFLDMRRKVAVVVDDTPLPTPPSSTLGTRTVETSPKRKLLFVAIPTTSGTGSEVTPFAVVTNKAENRKHILGDWFFTPDIAIVDPKLTATMPSKLAAATGVDSLTHAIESFVSIMASPLSDAMAIHATRLLLNNLPRACATPPDLEARKQVHYASSMAGMAIAQAFVGASHACSHLLGAIFHMPHGIANAVVLPHVIAYNATHFPSKYQLFPQYRHPCADTRYADLATMSELAPRDAPVVERVAALIRAVRSVIVQIGLPLSIREATDFVPSEKAFLESLDVLAMGAFEDMSHFCNPRGMLVSEAKQILLDSFYDSWENTPFAGLIAGIGSSLRSPAPSVASPPIQPSAPSTLPSPSLQPSPVQALAAPEKVGAAIEQTASCC